ncbi:MAG: FtsX-like permease family protein [Flavobacteriales bacterium]|nr:FtsX-like permease family protein [Flavobacteriales bacterium]
MMLVKIAWKNIWRHKVRSFVVISAIAIGLMAGIFASAFVNGMMVQKIDSVVKMELSHFQIHDTLFRKEMSVKAVLEKGEDIMGDIIADDRIKIASGRVISTAMLGSANYSGSVKVVGIDPKNEALTTGLAGRLVEGKYFEGVKRNPIFISQVMADKYKIKIRSKVVLTLQDITGEMVAESFKVVGIFDSKNKMYDKLNVFVRKSDLRRVVNMDALQLHEIGVLIEKDEEAEVLAEEYQEKYSELEVLPWLDLASGMRYMVEATGMYTYILVGIILVALLFSIINTMLMAVLERVKEIGMLMAVGMKKQKIFGMVMLETVFLSFIGAPVGLLISYLLITHFGEVGIDLAGAAYEDVGFATVIYPFLDFKSYINILVMVFFMAVFAAIYPAIKALSLNPVEAIRK